MKPKDRWLVGVQSLIGTAMGGCLLWFTQREGTFRFLLGFFSPRLWLNVGTSFHHSVLSGIGAVFGLLVLLFFAFAALGVTFLFVLLTAFSLTRFVWGFLLGKGD
jgi:hypothetical protein